MKRYAGQCLHVWEPTNDSRAPGDECRACGATCVRENGVIVMYDANVPIEPRRQRGKRDA